MSMRTRQSVVICTRACAVKNLSANALLCMAVTAVRNPQQTSYQRAADRIGERKQAGHWEGDTVIGGAHKQAIMIQVELKIESIH